jgi:hypothetical protein
MSDNVIDAAHLAHQREWSARTFGPGARTAGVLDHITKEIEEVRAAPEDVTEWADLLILAFDGAWRAGHEPQTVIDAIKAKQERNESREWPDWRNADPNKAIEHVRDEEPFDDWGKAGEWLDEPIHRCERCGLMPRLTAAAMASNYKTPTDWCNGCGLYAYVNAGEHRADCTRDNHTEPQTEPRTT